MYIPTGIKRTFMRFGVNLQLEGTNVGAFYGGLVIIHSSGQTISSLSHIEGIMLGAGEEV
jgi:hypothetical protein